MSTEHAADVVHLKGEIQSCYFNTLFHYCCILIILMYQNTIKSTYANVLIKIRICSYLTYVAVSKCVYT